jgi:hypothetical protein
MPNSPDNASETALEQEPEQLRPGVLRYKLYAQDGSFVHLTCADTPDMRRFTRWVRMHDRYTTGGTE